MVRLQQRYEDIEAYQEAVVGFDVATTQLDPGRIALEMDLIEIGDVVLREFRSNLRIAEHIRVPDDHVALIATAQSVFWRGHEIPAGMLGVLPSGSEGHACMPAGWRAIELVAPIETVAAHGVLPERWLESSPASETAVVPLARRQRQWLSGLVRGWRAGDADVAREEVLARYRSMVCRPVEETREELGPRARRLLTEAERIIRRDVQGLHVEAVAHELGVSDRWLQLCFRSAFGIGPYRYSLLFRLQQARRALLNGPGRTVAAVARTYGFQHLSRFSGLYREHFGERPSATLARRR